MPHRWGDAETSLLVADVVGMKPIGKNPQGISFLFFLLFNFVMYCSFSIALSMTLHQQNVFVTSGQVKTKLESKECQTRIHQLMLDSLVQTNSVLHPESVPIPFKEVPVYDSSV